MWVAVTDRLPEVGVQVYVRGHYIAPNSSNPRARLCRCTYGHPPGELHFESNQWRGMVGITHWWDGPVPGEEAVAEHAQSTTL